MEKTIEQYDKEIADLKNLLDNEFITSEIPVYSRIVGYYGATQMYNKGKKAEFKNRIPFKFSIRQ